MKVGDLVKSRVESGVKGIIIGYNPDANHFEVWWDKHGVLYEKETLLEVISESR